MATVRRRVKRSGSTKEELKAMMIVEMAAPYILEIKEVMTDLINVIRGASRASVDYQAEATASALQYIDQHTHASSESMLQLLQSVQTAHASDLKALRELQATHAALCDEIYAFRKRVKSEEELRKEELVVLAENLTSEAEKSLSYTLSGSATEP